MVFSFAKGRIKTAHSNLRNRNVLYGLQFCRLEAQKQGVIGCGFSRGPSPWALDGLLFAGSLLSFLGAPTSLVLVGVQFPLPIRIQVRFNEGPL